MRNTFYLKIAKTNSCGLCNQLYALAGCINYAILNKNINIIVVDDFLKEINTYNYCSIREVLNITLLNKFLKNYNIIIIDKKAILEIISVYVDKIELTDVFKIKINNNSLKINLDTLENLKNRYGNFLIVEYKIQNNLIKQTFDLSKENENIVIGCDQSEVFKQSPILYLGHSPTPDIFNNIVINFLFNENFYTNAKKWLFEKNINDTNIIHLRLEKDAIDCYSKELRMKEYDYLTSCENKYISMIKKYIDKNIMTIVLTGDTNNKVIKFLEENNYLFITTEKKYTYREFNAINDLIIGESCNNILIASFESSFSFVILNKILKNNKKLENFKGVICYFNNNKKEDIYLK